MKALIFLTIILLLSINVLQPKKYLIEVDDEVADSPADYDDYDVTVESKKIQYQNNIS